MMRLFGGVVGLVLLASTGLLIVVRQQTPSTPAWIGVISYVRGNAEIYRLLATGGQPINLSQHAGHDVNFQFSPKSDAIVFVSDRDGDPEVYRLDIAQQRLVNLTASEGWDDNPRWSPDGQWIAFRSGRLGGRNAEIYRMRADGSDVQNLTNYSGWDSVPIWSPDGQWIAFLSERDGSRDIYRMRADGSDLQRLTFGQALFREPMWTADGQALVMVAQISGGGDIFRLHVDTLELENITKHPSQDWNPILSPDGQWVAFETFSARGQKDIFRLPLAAFEAGIAEYDNLTNSPDQEFIGDWSDTWLLYDSVTSDGKHSIYRLRVKDGYREQLTKGVTEYDRPQWSSPISLDWLPALWLGLGALLMGAVWLWRE